MRCGQLGIRMDDFLLVHNIAPSSYTFLCNNLSLQIYDRFITWGRGMPTSCESNRLTICERSQNTILLASTQAVYKAPHSTVREQQCESSSSSSRAAVVVAAVVVVAAQGLST